MPLGLDFINRIQSLGLDETIEGGTSETGENLLGEGMAIGLAILGQVIFVGLHSLKGSSTTEQLMGQCGLVL